MNLLKPGVIVNCSVKLVGGVKYFRKDLSADEVAHRAASVKGTVRKWESVEVVDDAEERDLGKHEQSNARKAIEAACCQSGFFMICPTEDEANLDEAIRKAEERAAAFNKMAWTCKIAVHVVKSTMMETDSRTTVSVATELQRILGDMREAVLVADVVSIRRAATEAKELAVVLDTASAAAPVVSAAVSAARATATEILKRLKKGAEVTEENVLKVAEIEAAEAVMMKVLEVDGVGDAIDPTTLPGWKRDAQVDLLDVDADAAPVAPTALEGWEKPKQVDHSLLEVE